MFKHQWVVFFVVGVLLNMQVAVGNTRIIGGSDASVAQLESIVAIVLNDSEQEFTGKPFCAGTLITQHHIITAAHCMENMKAEELLLYVGEYDLSNNFDQHIAYANRIIKHDQYNSVTQENDIAIIETIQPVVHVSPVKVASGNGVTKGDIYGWGVTATNSIQRPDRLRVATVDMVSEPVCVAFYAGTEDFSVGEKTLCASASGIDSCQGDSGGPLLLNGSSSMQLGVTSQGYGCADSRYPGIYTKLEAYIPWLMKQISLYVDSTVALGFGKKEIAVTISNFQSKSLVLSILPQMQLVDKNGQVLSSANIKSSSCKEGERVASSCSVIYQLDVPASFKSSKDASLKLQTTLDGTKLSIAKAFEVYAQGAEMNNFRVFVDEENSWNYGDNSIHSVRLEKGKGRRSVLQFNSSDLYEVHFDSIVPGKAFANLKTDYWLIHKERSYSNAHSPTVAYLTPSSPLIARVDNIDGYHDLFPPLNIYLKSKGLKSKSIDGGNISLFSSGKWIDNSSRNQMELSSGENIIYLVPHQSGYLHFKVAVDSDNAFILEHNDLELFSTINIGKRGFSYPVNKNDIVSIEIKTDMKSKLKFYEAYLMPFKFSANSETSLDENKNKSVASGSIDSYLFLIILLFYFLSMYRKIQYEVA